MEVNEMQTLEPQVSGALIGASVTFIVSIVVLIFTNMGNAKRQRLQHEHEHEAAMATLYREKLEDIYMSFLEWERMFGSIYVSLIGYVKGELSEKDAYSMFKNQGTSGNIGKVEMLISLYYPELNSKYKSVMAERGKIVKYFPPNQSLIGDYSGYCTTQKSFEKSAVEFKEALKEQIDKLL
jgi:hypothetical protein